MGIEYAIIIKNHTRLESLIQRFNTKAQAKFYIEGQGGNFDDYDSEHELFYQSLHSLQVQLSKTIKHKVVERSFLPNYIFSNNNLLLVIGQDGLVANAAKYSKGLPIIAVNPDKARYDGVLLPFDTSDFISGVEQVLANTYQSKTARLAEVRLNDGQRLLAFNDLYIGAASHVSARYRISFNQQTEEHSSSGIIISTPAGATGWLSSLFNMAYGVAGMFEKNLNLKRPKLKEQQLLFVVREPFASVKTQTGISTGLIVPSTKLTIESLMPANGVIFSDGIEKDFLHFNSGAIAHIGIAQETATLVMNKNKIISN